jgi:hypothetical protein
MSLDTLLEIGKVLRSSPDGLKHHRYVKTAPKSTDKLTIKYINIPVTKDFEILFDKQSEIKSDFIKEKLYYLNFKTGADGNVRYLFGDICFANFKKDKKGTHPIDRTDKTLEEAKYKFPENSNITKFRHSIKKYLNQLSMLVEDNENLFIHFDFDGKHWYKLENEWKQINDLQMSYFASFNDKIQEYVLGAYLHRSLRANDYKAKTFKSLDEISDLMYAIDYSKRSQITEREIKIIVLPNIKTKEVNADDLQRFFEKSYNSVDDSAIITEEEKLSPIKRSSKVLKKQEKDKLVEFTESLENNTNFNIFDFIFTKAGGATSPDYDLIEISGIQKSFLIEITKRIISIKEKLHNEFKEEFPNMESSPNLQVFWAFNNILGDVTKDKKKYRNHLLKVLPKIYTASYVRDDLILPCFIQQVETKIRDGTENYNFLKSEYYFLVNLRNLPDEPFTSDNGEITKMKESISYQIGLKLGELAKPFRKNKDGNSLINSFEVKNLGYLTRRITDLNSLKAFQVEILQKIQLHQKHINEKWFYHQLNGKTNSELVEEIKQLQNQTEEKYNKHECAFGFFESYFKYTVKENPPTTATEQITEGE